MHAKKQHGTCGYCGQHLELTRDHVPPKLLLEKPYPINLLTVPSCYPCNQSFKADDEYTRTVLALDFRAGENTAAQSKLPAVLRSLRNPEGRGFAQYLAGQSTKSLVLEPGGCPMAEVIEPDRKRIDATGARIIRGLYFLEMGEPLPENGALKVASRTGLTPKDPDMKTIVSTLQVLTDHRNGAVGNAFSYLAGIGPGISFWLLMLYDYFFWAGTIDKRDLSEREPDAPEPRR
jgi:hypothetical protein